MDHSSTDPHREAPLLPRGDFDCDLPPDSTQNLGAARKLGLYWNPKSQAYCDEEGSMVRDRFGQPL